MPAREGKVGRPSVFTEPIKKVLLESVQAGQSFAQACRRARIDPSTLSHWAAEVDEIGEKSKYFQFINDLMQAEATGQLALILTVKSATKADWKAAAWLLERKWPDEYGRKDGLALGLRRGEEGEDEAAQAGGILEVLIPVPLALPPLPGNPATPAPEAKAAPKGRKKGKG